MADNFRYKSDIVEELGETKCKLNHMKEIYKEELRDDIRKEYSSLFDSNNDVELLGQAKKYIYSQSFATNCNGVNVVDNLICYRVDEVGFWFHFNLRGDDTKQTYRVSREELKDFHVPDETCSSDLDIDIPKEPLSLGNLDVGISEEELKLLSNIYRLYCSIKNNESIDYDQEVSLQDVNIVKEAITDKEINAIIIRYGLDGSGYKTCEEAANIIGVSRQSVDERIKRGFKRLEFKLNKEV